MAVDLLFRTKDRFLLDFRLKLISFEQLSLARFGLVLKLFQTLPRALDSYEILLLLLMMRVVLGILKPEP